MNVHWPVLAGFLADQEWGDVPAWITTFVALGGVVFGAINLSKIRRDSKRQHETRATEQRESQARLVWWVAPGPAPTRRRPPFVVVEVHNDSDRPIFVPIFRTETRESLLVSTSVDVVKPRSVVLLRTANPPRPVGWGGERRRIWKARRQGRRLYFEDAQGRIWERLGRGDSRVDRDVLKEVPGYTARLRLLRAQSDAHGGAGRTGSSALTPGYSEIEAAIRNRVGVHNRDRASKTWDSYSTQNGARDVLLAQNALGDLGENVTPASLNKALMIVDHIRHEP